MADRQSKLNEKKNEISGLLGGLLSPKDDIVRSKVFEIRKILQDIEKIVPAPNVIYDWDQYFMSIACLAALRSKDQSTPVGACIVNSDKRVVGIGYNSMPYIKKSDDNKEHHNDKVFPWKGKEDETFNDTRYDFERKHLYVVHAAVNAIINRTTPSLEGCTIYVTLKPDRDCAHAIIQAGISTVKYGKFIKPGREDQPDIIDATELLHHGEVNLIECNLINEPKVYTKDVKKVQVATITEYKVVSLSKRLRLKQSEHIEWDQFFMAVAMLSARKQGRHERSPKSTQGACIVTGDRKVISIGYSGYPERMNYRAVNDEMDMDYYVGDPHICHAEYDAILSKGTSLEKGCILYVTKYPCNDCAKVIVQSGIKKVIYAGDEPNGEPHTLKDISKETNKNKKKEKKEKNMYLGSKKILQTCLPLGTEGSNDIALEEGEENNKRSIKSVDKVMMVDVNVRIDDKFHCEVCMVLSKGWIN